MCSRKTSPHDMLEPDNFDILSATWVLSCNDENNIITYEGLIHRLGLPQNFPIRDLVKKRRDLFRLGIPKSQLDDWVGDMKLGKRLPVWIREKPSEQRALVISSLSSADGFRSQFRSEANAEKLELNVVDWGLQHIERLRKAQWDIKQKSAKSWQMWLVFSVGVLNIFVTLILGIFCK
jgi:hypothetical protein